MFISCDTIPRIAVLGMRSVYTTINISEARVIWQFKIFMDNAQCSLWRKPLHHSDSFRSSMHADLGAEPKYCTSYPWMLLPVAA